MQADAWRRTSFICRYGHQDVYRLLGRDPVGEPLTDIELELFYRTLRDHVESEFKPRAEEALVTGRLRGED